MRREVHATWTSKFGVQLNLDFYSKYNLCASNKNVTGYSSEVLAFDS